MKKYILTAGASFLLPVAAYAQSSVTDVNELIGFITSLVDTLTILLVTLAVLIFMWGAFQWISAGADEEKKSAGKSRMINGVIGIVLMISVWGLINLIANTFALDEDTDLNTDDVTPDPVLIP